MEIEITSLLENDMFEFSHSRAEGGQNAGQNTWRAALDGPQIIDTDEKREAVRSYMKSTGAWDEDEREAMTDADLNALFLQIVAGDCREAGADSLDEMDWKKYQSDAESGRIQGRFSRADNGQIWIYLGE